ncbi:MAG: undecaprenyldiphospho-muramoylpentapeptide beta-N-acetylglucosaminyltransferase [Candidatus Omnitrophota bacterium]
MKIIVATGGTGGHIFPALQTADVLRKRGHEVVFMGVLGLGEEKVKAQGYETILIHAKGWSNRSIIGLLGFSFLMVQAVVQAILILNRAKADKVIGFGGYGSFAVVLAARVLNIPTMIHEQNVFPGKANRFLSGLVKKIAISFEGAKEYLNSQKVILTGCPCHQGKPTASREDLFKKYSLDLNRKTILVLGGSQGSQKLNEIIFEMISSFGNQSSLQVIHMTGAKEYSLYAQRYQERGLPVKVYKFISPIEEVYAVADIVISRAGAATVSELGFFALPCVLVPYPLADGHQKYNAQVLEKEGLAKIIEQKDLTSLVLKDSIETLLQANFDREAWRERTKDLFHQQPAENLATALESL